MGFFIQAHNNLFNKYLVKWLTLTPLWYKYAYANIFSKVGAHIGHSLIIL